MVDSVMQRPRRLAAKDLLVDAEHDGTEYQSLARPRLEIARPIEFVIEPAGAKFLWIAAQFIAAAAFDERLQRRFGGKHAGFDGGMRTLDARGVEKTGVVADQAPARKHELRQRLQPAGGQRPRAVTDAPSALEILANQRMGL